MLASITALLFGASIASAQAAGSLPITDLVGTWSSKSNSTFTGPGFYDPVKDELKEPKLTGISYSFSADGHYEEAYYRAIANPSNPKCPKGIMQWQHGTFIKNANGSLSLTPIAIDGRQLYSDPCSYKNGIYTRYNATTLFQRYAVGADGYTKKKRLDIFRFDGSPLMPLYFAFSPPEMLPTQTLSPTTTETAKPSGKVRRGLGFGGEGLGKRSVEQKRQADRWWWVGVVMTASGGVMYYLF